MKLFLALMILSFSAFAQYYPFPGRGFPYPDFPRLPEDYCSKAQIKATTELVLNECVAKMTEFSSEHAVNCEITRNGLNGCRAMCHRDQEQYARLRMDVISNCNSQKARLKKTVITYY